MLPSHREAQDQFAQMGRTLGYAVRPTWRSQLPTDGVWLIGSCGIASHDMPVVALEVAASEGAKSIRGSIATLAAVSPAIGLIVIHDQEIRRRTIRSGGSSDDADRLIRNALATAHDASRVTSQRITLWTATHLTRRHALTTGGRQPYRLVNSHK